MKTLRTVGWLVLAGTLCGCDASRKEELLRVQYRVTGNAPGAQVKYSLPRGSIEQRTVSVPFTSAEYRFHFGDVADIEARNTGASGDLRVEILVEGRSIRPYPPPSRHLRPSYTTNAYGTVGAADWLGMK
jgi:hypothetical protein